ncbi:MAG: hypothetical protein K9K38_15110 [Rhodoferax sp.]|nr:hypothetical protein [Rhodoferax sp.]
MHHPTPAIVAQSAVRRFPRRALLALCVAYVLAGFVGRDAWKSADMTALGFMADLATGNANWWTPTLAGLPSQTPTLLPFWLGAWAIALAPPGVPIDFMVRIPFGLLLTLALVATWYGTYYLARSPLAQPVAFAFGGEARPLDYARAMADGGLLAFMACLGLAQLSHETTPALAQLGFIALLFYAFGALPYRRRLSTLALPTGLLGLTLSGAPMVALLLGWGGSVIHWLDDARDQDHASSAHEVRFETAFAVFATLACALLAWQLDLWRWKIELPRATWQDWNGIAQLFIWFTWPAWPLVLWTVWRWRHQLFNRKIRRHVGLPAWFVLVTVLGTLTTGASDRSLLLALPALATLAAFALPTLERQVAALIDWFTLLFFSTCGFIIWVVWIAMQTGFPSQPAANVARLAPGFNASFSLLSLTFAITATLAWAWLVRWRVGRHRSAIWKSLVLPAGGAALCWLLLMTLWMPLLNYALSYSNVVRSILVHVQPSTCIEASNVSQGQIAALQVYGKLKIKKPDDSSICPWLLSEPGPEMSQPSTINRSLWTLEATLLHPADTAESLLLFKRNPAASGQ